MLWRHLQCLGLLDITTIAICSIVDYFISDSVLWAVAVGGGVLLCQLFFIHRELHRKAARSKSTRK
jgi:hypothetical protein